MLIDAQLTFGGYKGAALSVMIELLAGSLVTDITRRELLVVDGSADETVPMGERW